jgi:DNA polymerase-3 subunit beta
LARSVHLRIDQVEASVTAAAVGGHDLAGALGQVLVAMGRDLSRPVLTCLLIEARDGSLRLVATDSYRLAVRDLPLRRVDSQFRALIAGPMAHRLGEQLGDADEVSLDLDEGGLRVGLPGGTISIELVPAEFPRYESLLAPEPDARSLMVEKSRLADALERVGEREDGVLLTFEPRHLVVDAESTIRLDANYEGSVSTVAVNARFAREAVAATLGPTLHRSSGRKTIRPAGSAT